MAYKYRAYKGQSEDEDSHNYIDDESDALTFDEESDPYEYNYGDAIIDYLYSKRVIFFLIALLVLIIAMPLWNKAITVTHLDGTNVQLFLGNVCCVISGSIIIALILEYLIEKASLARLKKARGSGAFWFYTNELSFYISFMITAISIHIYMSYKIKDFYLENPYGLKFYAYDVLKIAFLTTLVLAFQKAVVKNISMGFNYNLYINRIKKCILFDFFVNLISHIPDTEDEGIMRTETTDPVREDTNAVLIGYAENIKSFNTFILEKRFRSKDSDTLGLDAKRMLLKEFQGLVKNTISYTGSLPAILAKIRAISASKANKLVRKLIRSDKIEKFGDLGKFFYDQEIFEYILDQLSLSKEEKIERSNVIKIIEKAYRERYVINNSIVQINAAINKVAFFCQIGTAIFAFIAAYISAIENKGRITGVVSAIFSAQFVNRIISDGVIKSLLFLFVIHPFDIGDRVMIMLDGNEENLIVAELNVFSTLFYRWDGTSIFIPNHVLADRPVTNIRRSGPTMETHAVQINASTDPAKLYVLKQMLVEFARANSEIFTDYVLVNYEKIENSHKLHIKVLIQYQTNFQNYESYLKRKSYFIIELNHCLRRLGITYNLPVQQVSIVPAIGENITKSAQI